MGRYREDRDEWKVDREDELPSCNTCGGPIKPFTSLVDEGKCRSCMRGEIAAREQYHANR